MIATVKIIPSSTKSYFFILPKKRVRLAVVRNRIKRHVRQLTQQITAKIVVRIHAPVTKKNLTDALHQIQSAIPQS